LARINLQHARELDEFDHVDSTFARLYATYERMRSLETGGQVALREFSRLAGGH
jgi:hypothetical protein